ncbi:hypothetical protein H6P81_012839 [Aristolochia fimbriata]|uniref:Uncharacterized protein n=1 Tax=Aristolochia fimbriata TaxID=158543 RepID=A0AAV7EFU5_ARIFI|nr:hypothetical protein H6P81_012839 [Aristolochia fimbriata]
MIDPREDEWEVCDDDGFVYKRRKRTEHLFQPSRSAAAVDELLEAEMERRRLLRKKRTLLMLRREYGEEIRQWEELSAKLKQMKVDGQRVASLQRPPSLPAVEVVIDTGSERLVDELLMQVEVQEEIIKNVSNLCDMAKQLCQNREEQLKQSLFDLPVWASPTALMASLSEVANMVAIVPEG